VSLASPEPDEIVPLDAWTIRARARPKALLAMWLWQSTLALAGGWPAVALVRGAYGRHPRGDGPLWDGGALALLGLLSREANGVRAATAAACLALVVGALAGLVPMAALAISLAHATREGRAIGSSRAIAGAIPTFRPFAMLLVVVSFGQGLLLGGAILMGEAGEAIGHASLGEARAQAVGIGIGLVVLSSAMALGVVHDLARAAVVRFDVGGMRALAVGFRAFRAAPIVVIWAWAWRFLASVVPVVVVGAFADRFGGRGGVALVGLAALHQGVVFSRVGLRASWLARALRVVRTPHVAADDTDFSAA
jgi:hypothetical protein